MNHLQRLEELLTTRLAAILTREAANLDTLHLYTTGEYWVAFEASAYRLQQLHPTCDVMPLMLTNHPTPLVMASIPVGSLNVLAAGHPLPTEEADHTALAVTPLSPQAYHAWRRRETADLMELAQ